MKKSINKLIATFLMVSLMVSSISVPVFAEGNKEVIENRQEDLEYIYSNLMDIHPNLFANTPEEKFLMLKADIESKISEERNIDFALDLVKFAALVGDSHTGMSLNNSIANEMLFYPIEIDWYDGNWYITMAKGADTGMIGMQVTAINGIGMNDVLDMVSPYISHDNEVKLQRQFTEMSYIADLYKSAGIVSDGEPLVLSLSNSQGMKRALSVKALTQDEISNYRYANLAIKRRVIPATEYDDSKYYFSKALNDSIYYIQYNRCSEDDNYSIDEFYKDVKSDLDKGDYKYILVDLRNNGGGAYRVIEPIMMLLKQRMDDNGTKIAALVGESTFSAAIINAVEFQEMGCVLAGEATSGSVNHFGAITSFKMPNSQFNVSVSTAFISLSDYFDAAAGKGIEPLVPDVVIPQTIDDYLAGKDSCVEKILSDPSCLNFTENENAPLTRGRFIGKLYEGLGSPETNISYAPYNDLFGFEWYIPALNWAKENNISSGSSSGSFNPASNMTWEELSVFMVRAIKAYGIEPRIVRESLIPDSLFTDNWSKEYVECAWKWGLIPENGDFSKSPTRADGKTMINVFNQIDQVEYNFTY